jgi:hypothetical protein
MWHCVYRSKVDLVPVAQCSAVCIGASSLPAYLAETCRSDISNVYKHYVPLVGQVNR